MQKKRIAAIIISVIIATNNCINYVPGLCQKVYAGGNFDSTSAQLYHDTIVVTDYNDGSVSWSYRLNKATKDGYTDNITDLKYVASVDGSTEITVPSMINGVAVTEIGKEAFASNTSITSVAIPKTVTRICDKAFYGCKNLTTVTYEDADSVEVLGERAFAGCSKLAFIILGVNLMKDDTTGNYVFENCENLESVVINNTDVLSIQEGTFDGCLKLKEVNSLVSSPKKSFNIGRYAFRNTLVETLDFNVPVIIGEEAFESCKRLRSVTFEKSATIGTSAFSNSFEKDSTVSKKYVTFNGVTNTLGESSFNGCAGITSMEFSDSNSVINLEKNCFNGTESLNEIDFKGKNVNVGVYALNGMSARKVSFSNTERTEVAGDLYEKDNFYCDSISFNSKNIYLACYEQVTNKVFSRAINLKNVYFMNNVASINAVINGGIHFTDMYFYNPNISGTITDTSNVSYNVYGYWKNEEGNKDTLYAGSSSFRKYVDLQKAIEVEYSGPATILAGSTLDSSKIKVSNILFDDSREQVSYSEDNSKYSGFVVDQSCLNNVGKQTVTVSYWNCSDSFDVNVVTPSPVPTKKPLVTPNVTGTVVIAPTDIPGSEENTVTKTPSVTEAITTISPTITPTKKVTAAPVPTNKPSVGVTVIPSITPKITGKPVLTKKPGNSVTNVPTVTNKQNSKGESLTIKCANKSVKLCKKNAKTTYKVITAKNIKIYPKAGNNKIYYQIVKKGKKLSGSKWKKASKSITLKSQGRYCVYFKYSKNGKDEVVKTTGVLIDKSAPLVDVDSKTYKLKVKDTYSGVKYIKVNGKKVKNGCKLKKGINVIEVVDKAGNKKKVSCNIA